MAATINGRGRRRGWAAALGTRALLVTRPRAALGVAVSIMAVALATVAVYGLKQVAPVVSLSVVYLPAVLLVSTFWGVVQGLLCSLLSAAAFNFFHIPPTGRFTIADGRNWVSLAAFIVVALVVSTVAELARSRALEADRRRREADLAAAMARELLLGEDTETALGSTARRVAEALGLASAAIVTEPAGAASANAAGDPARAPRSASRDRAAPAHRGRAHPRRARRDRPPPRHAAGPARADRGAAAL